MSNVDHTKNGDEPRSSRKMSSSFSYKTPVVIFMQSCKNLVGDSIKKKST